VVTESLFSMDGDIAPLAEYASVCRAAGAALIVDEAHAVGIYGEGGSGLIEETGVGGDVVISINTAGKALGVAGAFVAGPDWAIDLLIQRARPFIFSTAPPPAVAEALDASLTLVAREPERRRLLQARAAFLRAGLHAAGIDVPDGPSQIIPVVIGPNEHAVQVAHALQARGFDVRAIRPPSVAPGTARLRISVNVGVSEPVLGEFVGALAEILKEARRCPAASS
jgi:8-amino-7-oxononanoate synthase